MTATCEKSWIITRYGLNRPLRVLVDLSFAQKQLDLVQKKLEDEVHKKHRAEERAKSMKEYSERAKARCSELEMQNAELKGLIAELQGKLQKSRKSYRESGKAFLSCLFILFDSFSTASELSSQEYQLIAQQREIQKLGDKVEAMRKVLNQVRERRSLML